ncbi:MAG: hypothetical protein AB7F65_04150 [Dehalococcoidia bacterium]
MTFKWTYIAAAVLALAGIVVSLPVDGGLWGAVSHIHGIVLVAVGGLLVLLTRMTKPRPNIPADADVPFVSYPEQQVLAILDTRSQAAEAVRDLRRQEFKPAVNLYHGELGAAAIDSEGTVHGVTGVTSRSVEHLMTDLDDLTNYDEAIRSGKVVVAFDGSDEDVRRRGAGILKAHGGHDIQYFGPLAVEVLDVDRSRTRAS